MIAKRKGTNTPFVKVDRVQLEGSDIMFKADVMEFENESDCEQDKDYMLLDEIRVQAAIAAMQGTMTILGSSDRGAFREIVVEGYSGKEKTYPKEIAEFAVACADALIEELKKK